MWQCDKVSQINVSWAVEWNGDIQHESGTMRQCDEYQNIATTNANANANATTIAYLTRVLVQVLSGKDGCNSLTCRRPGAPS
jgi:hypothetical protein